MYIQGSRAHYGALDLRLSYYHSLPNRRSYSECPTNSSGYHKVGVFTAVETLSFVKFPTCDVISFLFVSIPLSISIASTIRVGRLLGAQNHQAARISSYLAVGISTVFMSVAGLLLYRLRGVVGYLFTSDLDVIHRLKMLMPVVASFQVINGLQGAAQGVMRGMCRHTEVFGYTFLSYWVIGFPLGIYLAFFTRPRNGLYGLWYGFMVGVSLLGFVLMFIIVTTNWEREVRRARVRAEKYQNSFDTVQASPHPGSRALGGFLLLSPAGDEELDDLERIEITLYEEDMMRAQEQRREVEDNDVL